jgi:hypothetical protein
MLTYTEVQRKIRSDDCYLRHHRVLNTVCLFSNREGASNGGLSEGETEIATLEKLLRDGLITRRKTRPNEGPGIYRYDLAKTATTSSGTQI